jgi:PIN domain nuclease of toxin-antitoxin system
VNVLLDTHVAIWAVEDNPRLSTAARKVLLDPSVVPFVGVVSLWEIAIKHALGQGKAAMPMSAEDALGLFRGAGFTIVPVTSAHVIAVEALPRHHDDPFDRLLVATAMAEPYKLLTQDHRLHAYGSIVSLV